MADPQQASRSNGSETPQDPPGGMPASFGEDYELVEEIARGAMGVVYRARQRSLGREVALKTILAGNGATDRTVQRFLSEAQSAARLDHPGIVPVHDVGHVGGQHYYTMAFIEGDSLAQRLEEGPLGFQEAARIALETAEALQSAHDAGVLHRDIKPGNVLLDGAGRAVVTDFGLSRPIEENSGLSQSGDAIGTPSYMAPEQAVGQLDGLGPTTDVYGVGALLYAMIAGRAPFVGPNVVATLQAVKERDPLALSILRPEVPRDLETICQRCLHKVPERRYATAAALAEDLRRWSVGEPIEARPVGTFERTWMWVRRHPMVSTLASASAILLIAGTLGITWQWRKAVRLLGERDRADAARIEAVRSGIESASASAVLSKLDDVLPLEDDHARQLEARASERSLGPVARARVHLGLVLDGRMPNSVLIEDLVALADRADEVRLLIEGMERSLAARPSAAEELVARLADELANPRTSDSRTQLAVRALALLRIAPEDTRWTLVQGDLEEHLLQVESQHLGDTLAILRRPPEPLVEAMLSVAAGSPGVRARRASEALCAWASERSDILLRLVLSVDGEAFPPVAGLLMRARTEPGSVPAVAGLVDPLIELLGSPVPRPAAPGIHALDPLAQGTRDELRTALGRASSRVTDRWALALGVDIDDVEPLTSRLRTHGFRPVRIRPYRGLDGAEWASAAWVRDAGTFEAVVGIDPWELQDLHQELESLGQIPTDIAVHPLVEGEEPLFTCIWAPRPEGVIEGVLRIALNPAEELQVREEMQDKLFAPVAAHFQLDLGANRSAHGSVWWRGSQQVGAYLPESVPDADSPRLYPERLVQDIQGVLPAELGQGEDCHPRWFAIATDDPKLRSVSVHADDPEELWERLDERLSGHELPLGIAVIPRTNCPSPRIATLWSEARIVTQGRIDHERRRRRAALALLHLDRRDLFWGEVGTHGDTGLANQLMVACSSHGLDPRLLLDRLGPETDPRARQLLIRGLGFYGIGRLQPSVLERLGNHLGTWTAEDWTPGLAAEVEWFVGRHDPDGSAGIPTHPVGRVAENDHRMIRIDPVGEPWFGSEPGELGRTSGEPLHRVRELRPFEISIAEVSQRQMEPFYAVYPALRNPSLAGEDMPARCSWFVAIAYCRWLSEQAGLEESEIPYPPVERIFSGSDEVLIPEDFEGRLGYRLPSEYEWEYACRSGSEDRYHFGNDDALLANFVIFKGSAADGPAPRTSRPPNAFGLFGTHGNLSEWTHSSFGVMSVDPYGRSVDPPPPAANVFEGARVVRGGSFLSSSGQVRSAVRLRGIPNASSASVGFRIVRTLH